MKSQTTSLVTYKDEKNTFYTQEQYILKWFKLMVKDCVNQNVMSFIVEFCITFCLFIVKMWGGEDWREWATRVFQQKEEDA